MNKLIVILVACLLYGCASAPTWKGMSERDIAEWKAIGFDAAQAQTWSKKGFNAEQSQLWSKASFDVESAMDWSKEKFNPEEAATWKQAGFKLDDAIDDRAKGLTPVKMDK
ncbi:hypothetical protein L2737_13335 [Shewanella electrodiphila]|uniref:Lipoprotein n=1 Tax=Shewanella electrodiphila TaxID=934143 RepID=A0ABT0KSJ1_9GAMM|nr:hypothetical protein [Shewanella electrodiphila]MCL1046295.1 hypothetical protein [Shewanella electrodiphila]